MHEGTKTTAASTATYLPVIAVCKCKTPPALDGLVSTSGWAGNATGSGLAEAGTRRLLPIQPTFNICYDDQAIYLAASVPLRPGAKLTASRKAGPALCEEDSVEFYLAPNAGERFFRFVINSAGALYAADSADPKWAGMGLRASASVREREWSVGLAVPFSALGAAAPVPNSAWGLNVCLNYPAMASLFSSWNRFDHGFIKRSWDGYATLGFPGGSWAPVSETFAETKNFGRLVFTPNGPVAQIEGLERLQTGGNELPLKIISANAGVASLRIWPKDDSRRVLVDVRTSVSDSASLPFSIPLPSAGEAPLLYEGELKIECVGTPVLLLPFVVKTHELAEIHPRAYIESDRLDVEVYPGPALLPPEEHSARVTIAPRGAAPTKTVTLPQLRLGEPAAASFRGKDIPARDLTLTATVTNKSGKTVLEWKRDIDAPLHPWWLDDRTGAEDVILPPYMPLAVDGRTVRPWGRAYEFANGPLPSAIETAGASVLAGPISFAATSGGKPQAWKSPQPQVTENTPGRATFAGSSECPGLRLRGTAQVEYDGMIRLDVELTPTGAATVDHLALEIPLKPEYAKYLYFFPTNWVPGTLLPPEERASNAAELPAGGYTGRFRNFVWLGDEDRGFSWFSESDENWLPADRNDAFTVVREADRVVLRLNLVKSRAITSPLKYTFGLQATPVKEIDKSVWDYRIVHTQTYDWMHRKPFAMDSRISFPAWRNIHPDRGTAELWFLPPCDSPAAPGSPEAGRNFTILWLDIDERSNAGICWCAKDGTLSLWSQADGVELARLAVPVRWKKGEWHHAAFSWGDKLQLHLDGRAVGSLPFKGLTPKSVRNALLHVGRTDSESPLAVDELRISSVARAPELQAQPCSPDAQTLLLDHFDDEFRPFHRERSRPAVAAGGPGIFEAGVTSGPGRYGRGVVLQPERGAAYGLPDQLSDFGVRTVTFHMPWSLDGSGYPLPAKGREGDLREMIRKFHERGMQILLYASTLTLDDSPEWELYHRYYVVAPNTWPFICQRERLAIPCCWSSKLRNMWLARQARLMEEYGADGFYLDGSEWPVDCANETHGCGYDAGPAGRRPTCNIFGTRDYMKRLFVACKLRNPDAQVNVHNSTCTVIPTLGWGTSSWDGEQWGTLPIEGTDAERQERVLKIIRLDAFRAEFMGRQWGVPSELLCYDSRNTRLEHLLAISLLHNVLIRPLDVARNLPRISALWRLYDDFGMKEATWLPYWSNGAVFRTNADSIKASAHRHPRNGLLILVSNLSTKPVQARVRIDFAKLGMATTSLKARDAMTEVTVDLDGDTATLDMAPFSYRYVRID